MTEASELASVLASRLCVLWGTQAEVTGVRPLPGGASRESWDIAVRMADQPRHPAAERHWWELYGTVRWALLCRRQAERYLADGEPSIELAVLGRRVCEQEYDILLALGHAAPLTVTDPLEGLPDHAAMPHDRPSGPELLRAVRAFLTTGAGGTDPRLRFHARVAANALRIAEREALLAAGHAQRHRARLATLGCADDAELCAKIRDRSLDHRFGEVVEAVRAATVHKLTVANPGHLALPG